MSPEHMIAAVKSADKTKSPIGASCYFVAIGLYWGIKVYWSQHERDFAVDAQRKAWSFGYAPAVGDSFQVGDQYCYVTERAEPAMPGALTYANERDAFDRYPNLQKEMWLLSAQLRRHGCKAYDMHPRNVGFLNGFLVMIDFGY